MARFDISPDRPLKIGTRGSPLALAQAHETRARLIAAHGLLEEELEIVIITTTGDRVQNRALSEIGGKGLFTKEIEEALLSGAIDIAVHSMKDMPVDQPKGLALDCFLDRADPRDGFVSPHVGALADLEPGATVGTSSMRRKAQLLARRPDLNVVEFRGTVQTRLRKLNDGVASATFLAMAGLQRLNAQNVPVRPLEPDDMLPAVAQGAIGIERLEDDDRVIALLAAIHDDVTGQRMAAERSFLAALDGSCQTPIAALAEIEADQLRLRGEILRPDGSDVLKADITCAIHEGAEMGRQMGEELRAAAGPGFFSHIDS